MKSWLFFLSPNPPHDTNHPVFKVKTLRELQDWCRKDPRILTVIFTGTEGQSRYLGGGATEYSSVPVSRTLLHRAVIDAPTELVVWLSTQTTDKKAFLSAVMLGKKDLVDVFCKQDTYQTAIAESAKALFEHWESYRTFELRQGYVRESQLSRHPCPADIFRILFSYMPLDEIIELCKSMEKKQQTTIHNLQQPNPYRQQQTEEDKRFDAHVISCIKQAYESVMDQLKPIIDAKKNGELDSVSTDSNNNSSNDRWHCAVQ